MTAWHAGNLDLPFLQHGFFGRDGGESEGIYGSLNCGVGSSDDRAAVSGNLARVASEFGVSETLTLYQMHSPTVVVVTEPWNMQDRPKADGMVTAMPYVALGILTADCAPVLFADPDAGVIGAAHAGWKGALAGIAESVVREMEHLGARRNNIRAAIGPCISQANYEVGEEFRERFVREDEGFWRHFQPAPRPSHFLFNLPEFVAARIEAMGLTNVVSSDACTYRNEGAYFSYRRSCHLGEPDYGRQMSAIMIKK